MFKNKKKTSSGSDDNYRKNNNRNMKYIHKRVIPIYIIFGFIIIIAIYFITSLSNIDTISVQGNEEVPDQQIIETSTLESGDPLWGTYFNREEVEQKIINDLPEVSQVDITFSGINDFSIVIEEFNTVAFLLDENDEQVKVLENGELVDTNSNAVGERPILLNFDANDENFDQLIEQLNQLDESIIQLISEIENMEVERNPLLIRSYMNDGSQVIASIPTYAERISMYPQLVEAVDEQTGIFDLEAGAYFTPFSNNEVTPYEESLNQENPTQNQTENDSNQESLNQANPEQNQLENEDISDGENLYQENPELNQPENNENNITE